MGMDDKERRQVTRLSRQFRMEISAFTFPLSDMRPVEVSGVDISTGGVAVQCAEEFGQGEQVQVKIQIPKLSKYHPGFLKVYKHDLEQYITAVAKIAWSRSLEETGEFLMGLKFVDIYEDDLKALHKLIESGLE